MHEALNLVLVILSFTLMMALAIKHSVNRRRQEEMNNVFLEEEAAANNTRRKEIDPGLYYTPNLSAHPPIPEGDPHRVERAASRKMIYFRQPMTNLELKKQYGPQQMETIAHQEENFNEYLKALTNWAVSLHENGKNDEALQILEYTLSLGSEFRNTYKITADIYAQNKNKNALEALHKTASEHHFRDSAIRNHILEYIEGLK